VVEGKCGCLGRVLAGFGCLVGDACASCEEGRELLWGLSCER